MSHKSLKKKRVLIFLRTFGLGGAERQASLLANYLVEEGARVAVWAYEKDGPLLNELDERITTAGITFNDPLQLNENRYKKAWSLFKIWVRIILFRPHAIFPFTQTPNEDMCYIWKWTGAKICIWNQRDAGLRSTNRSLAKKAWKRCPVFVTNSISGREAIERVIDPIAPIKHIPNGIIRKDAIKSAAAWRHKLCLDPKKDFVAVMIANLTQVKDHDTVVRAWRMVLDSNKSGRRPVLLFAGLFVNTHETLQRTIDDLDMGENVRLLGQVRDITGLLSICDLGIFGSVKEGWEGCPNGVLECMDAGLSVVASDIVGTRETLGKNNPGLVALRDPKEFASKVLYFMDDEPERKRVGEDNRNRIAEKFSQEAMFSAYTQLINTKPDQLPSDNEKNNDRVRIYKKKPKVTVLMPVYNAEKYLRAAVDSILGQTFKNFELLIINDGSTDNSVPILQSYNDPRIRIVHNERNSGIITSLNKGLDIAKGEYIARMDSDDISLPQRLEKQVAFMDSNDQVGVCGSWIRYIGDAPHTVVNNPCSHEMIVSKLLFVNPLAHPSVMLRKEFFDKHNLRYGNFSAAEDFELWQRCGKLFRLHNIPEVLLRYRIVSSSITHSRGKKLADTVNSIFGQKLEALGITADNPTIELHKKIGLEFPPESIEELTRVKDHLMNLWHANREKFIYPSAAFDDTLSQYWFIACTKFRGNLRKTVNIYVSVPFHSKVAGGRFLVGYYLGPIKRNLLAVAHRLIRR